LDIDVLCHGQWLAALFSVVIPPCR
jgi:hypothetical protein